MPKNLIKDTPLLILSYVILVCGFGGLGLLFFIQDSPSVSKGIALLSAGLIGFGLGEILNHPKQQIIPPHDSGPAGDIRFHRRRNVCALGNLLIISSLLLFFIGLSGLLYD